VRVEQQTQGDFIGHSADALEVLERRSENIPSITADQKESLKNYISGLREAQGVDCPYFKKSLDIFVKKDYIQVRDMVESIHNLFLTIEGKRGS